MERLILNTLLKMEEFPPIASHLIFEKACAKVGKTWILRNSEKRCYEKHGVFQL